MVTARVEDFRGSSIINVDQATSANDIKDSVDYVGALLTLKNNSMSS